MTKYTVVPDEDGHRFVIPADKVDEWWDWVEYTGKYWDEQLYLDNPDLDDPKLPDWAEEITGGRVVFENWEIE